MNKALIIYESWIILYLLFFISLVLYWIKDFSIIPYMPELYLYVSGLLLSLLNID